MNRYCASRYNTIRRPTREVYVGHVGVGGDHPIRVQSMATTNTQDVPATVKQCIALAEAGCEIIRITAPNKAAARALKDIRRDFRAAGFNQPLVADIHFLPSAAMEAVEHVEKVRVNPGNYADRKKFAVREYTDAQYESELQRLYEEFSPLVKRAKELGRSMRIGTNHGSLSDRIMNRYGDTPLGMVESALEFLRIAESHGYRETMLSMKASNPKVMIQAYRLLVERMDDEDMHYPLHLGVTEAGDGEDGRIKSAIGIGSLLLDGLGDTIRVSLTEDPVYEIPVAEALAQKVMKLWGQSEPTIDTRDSIDPYEFERRPIQAIDLSPECRLDAETPPSVITPSPVSLGEPARLLALLKEAKPKFRDVQLEGLLLQVSDARQWQSLVQLAPHLQTYLGFVALELHDDFDLDAVEPLPFPAVAIRCFHDGQALQLEAFLKQAVSKNMTPAVGLPARPDASLLAPLKEVPAAVFLSPAKPLHPSEHRVGRYRLLAENLKRNHIVSPIWLRNTPEAAISREPDFLSRLLEASILSGSLLCDGIGDLISVETEKDLVRATYLAYNVLQGAGARISKTEFVACPSCGRTLFDLQTTTQRIREKTGHLKGVKIAIMGCIVNGPGEMADADFGYVGGAPGKINLYVGKECVQYNIPAADADQRLIDLIRQHGKWTDPKPEPAAT